jgi:transcriptional regulator with XRE-family HTH domain
LAVQTFSGRKLYQARLRAGLSQEDLALALRQRTRAKTGPRNVRRWENGETTPHSALIPAIAASLDVSLDELYGDGRSDEDDGASREMQLARIREELERNGRADLVADLLALTNAVKA